MNRLVSASIASVLLLCLISPAAEAQHAPQDVRITASDGARVSLQWSRPARYSMSYELQRATGDGAFATIRNGINPSALTVTDTTAAVRSAYRYRLLARVTPVDSEYSNVVAVTTSDREVRRAWPPAAYLRPAVYGRVLDSLTGRPLSVFLTVAGQPVLSGSDSLGRYLFLLPPGIHKVSFLCPSRIYWGRAFTTRTLAVTAQTDSALDFHVVLRNCEEPPLRTWSGVFQGHYSGGFEESDFTPCTPFDSFAGTAYAGIDRAYAWVSFSDSARKQFRILPAGTGTSGDGAFVRWRATVTGPGSYGHMGVAMYDMRVAEILEMRAATPGDCAP